jgi:hypothetical protein
VRVVRDAVNDKPSSSARDSRQAPISPASPAAGAVPAGPRGANSGRLPGRGTTGASLRSPRANLLVPGEQGRSRRPGLYPDGGEGRPFQPDGPKGPRFGGSRPGSARGEPVPSNPPSSGGGSRRTTPPQAIPKTPETRLKAPPAKAVPPPGPADPPTPTHTLPVTPRGRPPVPAVEPDSLAP